MTYYYANFGTNLGNSRCLCSFGMCHLSVISAGIGSAGRWTHDQSVGDPRCVDTVYVGRGRISGFPEEIFSKDSRSRSVSSGSSNSAAHAVSSIVLYGLFPRQ